MTSILERNKNLKKPVKKTREEYAEDALYREVWEDVNNEKTQEFIKKYWRYIVGAVMALTVVMCSVQIFVRMHNSSRMLAAHNYEVALADSDATALANMAKDANGATADLALYQSYLLDKDVAKLENLAKNANTRDFKDLATVHLASINGDKMSATEFEKYLSGLDTKKSPFYYTARLMVAEKYLANGESEKGEKILDAIIKDKDAPDSISETAQLLR